MKLLMWILNNNHAERQFISPCCFFFYPSVHFFVLIFSKLDKQMTFEQTPPCFIFYDFNKQDNVPAQDSNNTERAVKSFAVSIFCSFLLKLFAWRLLVWTSFLFKKIVNLIFFSRNFHSFWIVNNLLVELMKSAIWKFMEFCFKHFACIIY